MSSKLWFATLRRCRRVWAVAAIHGEAERLARVHDEIERRFAPGDRLVYLGNYLGRGSGIRATVDELLRFRRELIARPQMFASDLVYLRGCQEEMWQKLLQLQYAPNPGQVLAWMLRQGVGATITAYGGTLERGQAAARDSTMSLTRWTQGLRAAMHGAPGHDAWFATLRRAAFTDDGQLLLVHAGLDPAKPLAAQGDQLWWGGAGFERIVQPYEGFRVVIRGYDHAHGDPVQAAFTTSIDAGCGFGGALLALCFSPEGEILDQAQG